MDFYYILGLLFDSSKREEMNRIKKKKKMIILRSAVMVEVCLYEFYLYNSSPIMVEYLEKYEIILKIKEIYYAIIIIIIIISL